MKMSHDPLNAAVELREQLASDSRRLIFFFGAGTSMAVGLPGIVELTNQVSAKLSDSQKTQFSRLCSDLPKGANIEAVLDRVRTLRDLIAESDTKEYDGLKRDDVKNLDFALCAAISEIVRKPAPKGLAPHTTFAQWIRALHSRREWPVEIFTTNYDLFFELAMEGLCVPFFDGFVGSVEAFFSPESVEATGAKKEDSVYPPRAWTRLWKLHGSVNWRIKERSTTSGARIFRTSESASRPGEELAVFPSHDKYSQSRKLPFLALQDRLRRSLSSGECLLVLVGYSFADQHINEIIFQGLRSNPRLAAVAFLFDQREDILLFGSEYRNLSIYTPEKAAIGGVINSWEASRKRKSGEDWPFWDETSKKFLLGDFNKFGTFLELFIGFRPIVPDSKDSKSPDPAAAPAATSVT